MALQRDFETLKEKNDGEKQPVCTNPLSVLKVVMKQCKNMQERMLSQLAAAESRHRKVGPRRRARGRPCRRPCRPCTWRPALSCQLPVFTVTQSRGLTGVKKPLSFLRSQEIEKKT